MKTILVPVDATSTSENTVRYAAEWGKQNNYEQIILLKTSYESMFDYINISEGYALVDGENLKHQQEGTEMLLADLRDKIIENAPEINVVLITSRLPVVRGIIDLIRDEKSIELIIIGSDHTVVSNDSFVSSSIIDIARSSPVKTLIVPKYYDFKTIKTILVPCDMSNMTNLDRLSRFRSVLKEKDVQLMLLNVSTKENSDTTDSQRNQWELNIRQYLKDIPYSIYYTVDNNVINGILSFTLSNKVDMIIALPGKHSFLYYLANRSISEGIYQNTDQAVLILK